MPDNTKEYRKAQILPPLDIPPDLSAEAIRTNIIEDDGGTATYLEYQEQGRNPLMDIYGVESDRKPRLEGEGEEQRLLVPEDQKKVWERVRSFWDENGLEIKAEDIRIGFMDTTGPSEQDSYRVRIERGETPRSTVIHLKQITAEPDLRQAETMLRRLAEYLGALYAQDLARAEQNSRRTTASPSRIHMLDGGTAMEMAEDFSRAWRQVGLVLDQKGFSVEDRNRSRGVYYIRYKDPFTQPQEADSGWFSKLAFWEDDEEDEDEQSRYQIKLISDGAATRVVILDTEGRRDESATAKRLLSLLGEQLTE
ncbi:outer membrane protein assembly factor BamC [Nitrosococcus watsonii]|uniref:outer membrane protein assembly factor BamC n=1 Tax=Nitrosococcus watsonii TaxID=473531 RepID=UPI001E29B650|nr:outer membrane protein assembly factor BamC [Nitrosococcus watsonii]